MLFRSWGATPRPRWVPTQGTLLTVPRRGLLLPGDSATGNVIPVAAHRSSRSDPGVSEDTNMTAYERALAGKQFIGGRWLEASSGATFGVEDPGKGEVFVRVADSTLDDCMAAVAAADEAAAGRAATPPRVARRDPAASIRPDDRQSRRHRQAHHAGVGQGVRRGPGRGRLRCGVPALVLRGGLPRRRHGGHGSQRWLQHHHHAAPGGYLGVRHSVELPGRNGDPEDRSGTGRWLHDHPQARQRTTSARWSPARSATACSS